jgi:hypothetical protein
LALSVAFEAACLAPPAFDWAVAAVFDFAREAAGFARDLVELPLFDFVEPDRPDERFVELPARGFVELERLLEALARLLELPLLADLPLLLVDLRLDEERLEPPPLEPLRELAFVFVLVCAILSSFPPFSSGIRTYGCRSWGRRRCGCGYGRSNGRWTGTGRRRTCARSSA